MKLPKLMCLDVETSGLDWTTDKLHGIGVGYEPDKAEYYPAWAVPEIVREHLANPRIPKIGHNLHAFDAKFIRKAGFEIAGDLHNTQVLANLIDDSQKLKLKLLVPKYIGEENLERKRALDRYMSAVGVNNVGALCAKDLLDAEHPHLDIIADYCKEDVLNTTALFFIFIEKLKEMDAVLKGPKFGFKKTPIDYYREEALPLERVLFEIEYRGIRVDMGAMERIRSASLARMAAIDSELRSILGSRIAKTEQQLCEVAKRKVVKDKNKKPLAPNAKPAAIARRAKSIADATAKLIPGQGECAFSWGNNNHVAELLYKNCGLPNNLIFRTDKGAYQTDKEAIGTIKANIPPTSTLAQCLDLFSEYKLHGKIASTYTGTNKKGIISKVRYIDGVPRIFPEYRQTTGTGRLACKNPNMQNLKRDSEVKRFFIPDNDDEVFDDADYSQIELRTGAHITNDAGLCTAYTEGRDVHLLTASRLFNRSISKADDMERQAGKRTNFLTIFDGSAYRLMECLKADTGRYFSVSQCKGFINVWFDTYPGVRAYLDAQKEFFIQYKFCISETGRVRKLPDIYFGQHIKWIKGEQYEDENGHLKNKWTPKYEGPQHKREELVKWVLNKNKKMSYAEVTEEMIGRAAWKRFSHAIKAGYNQPIQGLAASMTKRAMIALHNAGRIIANQVHDNLTVPRKRGDLAARQQVIDIMQSIYPLQVPVIADCKTISTFHPQDTVKE